ncbi:MAG: hypothetical protein NC548_31830 [Lachnospiraceae bacterium]|nr:hypothetical protein [Lachnospiraceae bacterium]
MSKVNNDHNIELDLSDAIMERPYGFSIGNRWLYLYPVTLGKYYLLSRLVSCLGINKDLIRLNPALECMRLIKSHKDIIITILTYHTIDKKEEIFDVAFVEKRKSFLTNNLSDEDIIKLLLFVLSESQYDTFIKHLGIDKERREQLRISKIKDEKGSSISFGGKSVYGSLIDSACERYGWTMDYVVWGISLINLRMILADAINTVYLSEEERKKAKVSSDRTRIKADDPKNRELIKSMKWD